MIHRSLVYHKIPLELISSYDRYPLELDYYHVLITAREETAVHGFTIQHKCKQCFSQFISLNDSKLHQPTLT